jgi:riboflavin biosynthesis pyrimidine reductase
VAPIRFDVLHPPLQPASAEELLAADPPRGVAVNMVTSLDGRVAVDGGSSALGGEGDHAMFGALRRAHDAVLAGTGTVRAERYGPIAGGGAMLFISRSGDVPWDAPLFAEPSQRVGIAGPVDVPARVRAQVTVVEPVEPAAALRALRAALGVGTVLCEGGPTLNRALLEAGVLDELFLTLDPSLRGGDAPTILAGDQLHAAARLVWALRAGDELLLRYAFD